MANAFFEHPILNSPYEIPTRHWELDKDGQPTQKTLNYRRPADFVTPVPKARKQRAKGVQGDLGLGDDLNVSGDHGRYRLNEIINAVRAEVGKWRQLPQTAQWSVTPETARLLQHWRTHSFSGPRPFFCQVEAVETAIWLTEVAPKSKAGKAFLDHLNDTNADANPGLNRLALKLATGAGKTTVMAMLIAWQTINAVRRPQSNKFTRGFLIVAPGLTIKDRLQVLLPNDPNSYYLNRELVPPDMIDDLKRCRIVITNYHAFKLRERIELSKGGRALLQGRGEALDTLETEGQMIQRSMKELMGLKNVMVINDEAHHCYREKPQPEEDAEALRGEAKKEAEENREAARLWISGLEAVSRNMGIMRVMDLSATPFFLSGSGYAEGTLFPWTMSDFSLMDAIECGIVKLPRVPVADNIAGADTPMYRNLWDHIGKAMPKKGRTAGSTLNPLDIPSKLETALDALYGHYEKTFTLWNTAGIQTPPCFIIVCNNTATSKLVYDYVSGFHRENGSFENGRLPLFRNYDEAGEPLARPNTLLIDSNQLESGEGLDESFRRAAEPEIAQFRRELRERRGDIRAGLNLTDADLLREVMNTVGKPGKLGASIRCVVSVSMLTEGWDANTVTHVLGVRAFGTQLLCEQVIGRALRRQSYELNEKGLFNVEYADVLGIPFDFTARPVVSPPQPPRETVQVRAVRPERDTLEIRFPRISGYRMALPDTRIGARFTPDSDFELTPDRVGATETRNSGIIGEEADLNLVHTRDVRTAEVVYQLTSYLVTNFFRDEDGEPQLNLFGQLKRITAQWVAEHLKCKGGTFPAQLKYKSLANIACERIKAAIDRDTVERSPERTEIIQVIPDPYNPVGSTARVNFTTSKRDRWQTDARKCQIDWVVLDSDWEAEFCRIVEQHPRVLSYVKNHNLGLEVPYQLAGEQHRYLPDFILQVDKGEGIDNPLNLIVEIKGYRGEDAKTKKEYIETYWIPGVNNSGRYGQWAFAELTDLYAMGEAFADKVAESFDEMILKSITPEVSELNIT